MNIVFMGTPDFASCGLEALYEAGHNILAVVSQPDKPSGRGMKLVETPTKKFALEKGIKVYQPEKIRNNTEFIELLEDLNPDVIVVIAYGKILPEKILQIPKYGCINVHGSLLPKYRGAAPIQWSIINGDKETGITTMFMDAGMDTGDMLLKEKVTIEKEDTYGTLYEKLKILGGKLIVKTLEELENGTLNREKQTDDFTVAPMIFKEDCKIDWNKSAFEIENLVRGVNPAPGAWTTLNDKVYKVWKCEEVVEYTNLQSNEASEDANLQDNLQNEDINLSKNDIKNGTILVSNSKEGLLIKTGSGIISIKEIQAPNSKRMNIHDYLRGNAIEVGNVLD